MKKIILSLLAAAIATTGLMAGQPIKVGTGSETGNYYGMSKDIFNNYCQNMFEEEVDVQTSGGSVDNLVGMTQKKYTIGIVQSDVLMKTAKQMPRKVNMNSMKIIAGLHNETVHLLVPVGYEPKGASSGNIFSSLFGKFNDKKPVELSLTALENQEVAAWGGSVVSAEALNYFFNLKWKVRAISPEQAEKQSVPLIIVGGTPYAPVEKILATGKWNLVSINYNEIAMKAPFYMRSTATYKVRGNPISVDTIGVQALMMGKSFRKAERNEGMINLATCIDESLADLADDPDTNANWGSVYENNEQGNLVNWSFFNTK